MKLAHMIRIIRKIINPPYTPREIFGILATITILLAIPLTVIYSLQPRPLGGRAVEPTVGESGTGFQPTAPYYTTFFYPWNKNPNTDGQWAHWEGNGHNPPANWDSNYLPDPIPEAFDPSQELYSSFDDSIKNWQLQKMAEANIEVAISSWWGIGDPTDLAFSNIIKNVMNDPANPYPNLRWAIYYEKEGYSDPTVAEIVADINHIKNQYGAEPGMLKINGKPVIFVFGGDAGVASRWAQAKAQTDIYVSLKVFNGFKNNPNQPDSWHQYNPTLRGEGHAPYSAFVSPGFWKAGETPVLGRNLDEFKSALQLLVLGNTTWKLIETWNEWQEGTTVEPGDQVIQTFSGNATLDPSGTSYKNEYVKALGDILPALENGTGVPPPVANKGFYTQAKSLVSDPLVTGLWLLDVAWKDIETAEGNYDWTVLDNNSKLTEAVSQGKRIRLKIEAGAAAPAWLIGNSVPSGGVCSDNSPLSIPQYYIQVPNSGDYCAPYVWDERYISKYENFIQNLGTHLSGVSYKNSIAMVSITSGPLFTEMITAGGQNAYNDSQTSTPVYTREMYLDSWKRAIDAAANGAFGTIPLDVNLSETWDQTQTKPWQFNDWVARGVGDYLNSENYTNVEISNDSIPGTYSGLVPYFQSQYAGGRAVSAQIGWNKLTGNSFEGEADGVVTYNELCNALKFAYDLGARAIEVNRQAYEDSTLRPAIAAWDPAFKETGSEPVNCIGSSTPPPTVDITANGSDGPISISYNTSVTIRWESTDANNCSISPTGWAGKKGTKPTGKLTKNTTFVANCSGDGGTKEDMVIVKVSSKPPATKLGDLNKDGKVDIFDLSILLANWGKSGTVADLNSSGKVDIFDLSILLSRWGK